MSNRRTNPDGECQSCHGTGYVAGAQPIKTGPYVLEPATLSGMWRHGTCASTQGVSEGGRRCPPFHGTEFSSWRRRTAISNMFC